MCFVGCVLCICLIGMIVVSCGCFVVLSYCFGRSLSCYLFGIGLLFGLLLISWFGCLGACVCIFCWLFVCYCCCA